MAQFEDLRTRIDLVSYVLADRQQAVREALATAEAQAQALVKARPSYLDGLDEEVSS